MLFNSMAFAIFLPIVFLLYWIFPHRFRWVLLLIASYYFYMSWDVKYIFLILFTTCVSYLSARILEHATESGRRKVILAAAIVVGLFLLFFYKYYDFFLGSFSALLQPFAISIHPVTLGLAVPIGISFYTFQSLGYVIDVYRGDIQAEHHFGKYAVFVSFFPQIVSGPIGRAGELLPQIKTERHFDYNEATYGLKLMALGFFKKLVLADNLGPHVDGVFGQLQNYTGFSLVLTAIFFSLQIYCDFSGYSDIAIGTARLFGINLMTNFKSPYFSASIKEFWSRWHISLSSWFRDYVYIPLGGNRVSKVRHGFNLLVTFLVSGLWHGAQWTFVLWGGLHGLMQVIENTLFPSVYSKKSREKEIRHHFFWWIRVIFVFLLCTAAWVLFRADNMEQVVYLFQNLFQGIGQVGTYLSSGIVALGITLREGILLGIAVFVLAVFDYLSLKMDVLQVLSTKKTAIKWAVYTVFVLYIFLFSPVNGSKEFIYFKF